MKPSPNDRPGSRKIQLLIGLLLLPLFIAAGLLSYPVASIRIAHFRRKERRFVHKMKLAGRVMGEEDLAAAFEIRKGTLIEEWSSLKHPVSTWWTEGDIPSIAPFRPTQDGLDALIVEGNDEFSAWCCQGYIDNANPRLVGSSYVPEFSVQARGKPLALSVVAVYKGYRTRQYRNPSRENH